MTQDDIGEYLNELEAHAAQIEDIADGLPMFLHDFSDYETEILRNECSKLNRISDEIQSIVESLRIEDDTEDAPELNDENIEKAYHLFLDKYRKDCEREMGLTYPDYFFNPLYAIPVHKTRKKSSRKGIVFVELSREARDSVSEIFWEARKFFNGYFKRDVPIYEQGDYILSECPSAYREY